MQSSSTLHIAVYGRPIHSSDRDIFLGEAHINLCDIDDVEGGKGRTFPLVQRRPQDRVGGSITLGIRWGVTPLQRLTSAVEARERDIDLKEELCAILMERLSYPSAPPGDRRFATFFEPPGGHSESSAFVRRSSMDDLLRPGLNRPVDDLIMPTRNMATPMSLAALLDSESIAKLALSRSLTGEASPYQRVVGPSAGRVGLLRSRTLGQFSVKVVEARNLVLPERTPLVGDFLKNFYTCDAFARLSVTGQGPQQTKVAVNSVCPQWNESFIFDQVGPPRSPPYPPSTRTYATRMPTSHPPYPIPPLPFRAIFPPRF